jgi:hypothetical protein
MKERKRQFSVGDRVIQFPFGEIEVVKIVPQHDGTPLYVCKSEYCNEIWTPLHYATPVSK